MNLDIFPCVVLRDIDQTLRHHNRDSVLRITESSDNKFHCIKALTKYLVAKSKACINFSHDRYLIIFNDFVCHK